MKSTNNNSDAFESTYALIIRSEERKRGATEGAVFLLFMLSAVFSIWQVAQQPITLPAGGIIHTAALAQPAVIPAAGV